MKITALALPLFLLTASNNGFALECYSKSPALTESRNLFEHEPPKQLSHTQIKNLNSTLNTLQGEWTGIESSFICIGNETSVRKKTASSELTLNIKQEADAVALISSKLYSREKGSTRQEHFSLHLVNNYLRLDTSSSNGAIELLSVDKGEISFVSRSFQRSRVTIPVKEEEDDEVSILPVLLDPVLQLLTGEEQEEEEENKIAFQKGGTIKEILRTIRTSGRQVEIDINIYTNGYLSSSYQWKAIKHL